MTNDHIYLAHHGIKGMKWGVRRYQNKDGTLTAEGKQHYGTSHPMTQNQAAKALLKANVTFRRKATRQVDKEVKEAVRNDSRAKQLRDNAEATRQHADTAHDAARYLETNYQNLRDTIDTSHYRGRLKVSVAKDNADAAWKRYDKLEVEAVKASNAYVQRKREIGHEYYEAYKRAAVKDLGIKDIDAGVKMLEEYGLEEAALGYRYRRYKNGGA